MNKLFIFCIACLVSTLVYSQNDTILLIPSIEIGDQRISLPMENTSRTISLLTKKEITKLPVQSINEMLSFLPGVDIKNRGIKGGQADLSIRGSTFEQVLVLINGIKMNDPQTGHHNLNIPIPVESLERVEVLKGPGARRFGQNAFAGAVNFITKIPENHVNVGLEGGSYGTINGTVGGALHSGDFKQALQLGYIRTDGYRHNTDFNIGNAFYQNEWQLGKGKFSTMAGFSQRKMGSNGFYASPTFTEQYEEVQTSIINMSYKWLGDHFHIQPSIHWRRNQDEYLLVRDDPSVYRNLHFGHNFSAEIQSGIYTDWGITGVGLEYRKILLNSNNLGSHDRDEFALFLEQRFEFLDRKLSVTPGFALNYFSDFGEFFYPGLDVSYQFSKIWSLYGNVGNTYRIPTYTDLYYVGPSNVGNVDLIPEKALGFEAGVKYFTSKWSGYLALFQRNSENLIDWVKNEETDPWQPQNFYKASFKGLEMDQQWILLSTPLVSTIGMSYTYIYGALKGSGEPGFSRYALDNLRHQVMVKLEGGWHKNWSYNIRFRFLDRVNLEDYSIADLKLNYDLSNGSIYAMVNNIFDTKYTETNLIPMPGRTYQLGMKHRFFVN